jgi:general secretion pathway protein I
MIARTSTAGFTLIEITVAFVILGLAAGALMAVLGASPARLERGHNQMRAVLAARSVLAEVDAKASLSPGEVSGSMQDDVTWKVLVQPYRQTPESAHGAPPLTVPYLVTVQTAVESGDSPATASLTTVRLQARLP